MESNAASSEGGEIAWGDETALVNTDVRDRIYPPADKTPVAMAVGGKRHKQIDRIFGCISQRFGQKSILDTGQLADSSQQACQGLGQ